MPNRTALIVDSTCDIPRAWREQYDLKVIPLTIVWGDRQYLDGVDLSAEAFYERLEKDPVHPTTSQPAPRSFVEAYREAAESGAQEALVFTISSAMSGTIGAARQAANEAPLPVTVVDSLNNSMGLGWQVIAAARAREAGGDKQAMLEAAAQARRNMAYYISLDTMEYLSKGGRIGGATKFLGTLLRIKPLIYVNPATGSVGASIPARSRVQAIDGLFKEFVKHIHPERPTHLTVLHNAAYEEAEALAERVRREIAPVEVFVSIVSPALGVHTGPRAIALCGYSEE